MPTTKEKAAAAAASVARVLTQHEQNEARHAAKRQAERDAAPKGPVMVRAKQLGFYGGRRRRLNEVFPLTEGRHFSSAWMEVADGAAPTLPIPTLERTAPASLGPTGDQAVL